MVSAPKKEMLADIADYFMLAELLPLSPDMGSRFLARITSLMILFLPGPRGAASKAAMRRARDAEYHAFGVDDALVGRSKKRKPTKTRRQQPA